MNNKTYTIELKWNNTCCRAICPISGDSFKPFFGMYPFIAGTFEPVSLDALKEFNPEVVSEILTLSHKYYEMSQVGLENDIPPLVKMTVYYPTIFVD